MGGVPLPSPTAQQWHCRVGLSWDPQLSLEVKMCVGLGYFCLLIQCDVDYFLFYKGKSQDWEGMNRGLVHLEVACGLLQRFILTTGTLPQPFKHWLGISLASKNKDRVRIIWLNSCSMNFDICIMLDQRAKYVLSSWTIIPQMLCFLTSAGLPLGDIKVLRLMPLSIPCGWNSSLCRESAQSPCRTQALSWRFHQHRSGA